jgi:DNA-binding NarL/FixJ family response regulator
MVKVHLADSRELIRAGLKNALSASPGIEVVGESPCGSGAIDAVGATQPDLVLVATRSGSEADALETTRRIKEQFNHIRVLMFAEASETTAVMESLAAGADAYVLDQTSMEDLRLAIHSTASGASWLDAAVSKSVLQALSRTYTESSRAILRPRQPTLTSREMQVLDYLLQGQRNAEIAGHLQIGAETVKTHVRHIMEKLGAKDRKDIVSVARYYGLIEEEALHSGNGKACSV